MWHQLVFHGNGCALPLSYHCYPSFTESFASNCTSAPRFVSEVDLMKWEEQVLFACLLEALQRLHCQIFPGWFLDMVQFFSPLLSSFPDFPQSRLQFFFFWFIKDIRAWKERYLQSWLSFPQISTAPCQALGWEKENTTWESLIPQGTRSRVWDATSDHFEEKLWVSCEWHSLKSREERSQWWSKQLWQRTGSAKCGFCLLS